MKQLNYQSKQTGAVLFVSLIILLIMTLLGVTGMQTTILEEKMAGNFRDKNVAFQAAESALRDAEIDIRSSRISGHTGMTAGCVNGLCYNSGNDIPDIWEDVAKVANATEYGAYTGASDLPGVGSQPKYLIVGRTFLPAGAATPKDGYIITAIGEGGSSSTNVILQSIYITN